MRTEIRKRLVELRAVALDLEEGLQALMESLEDYNDGEVEDDDYEAVADLHGLATTIESNFGDILDVEADGDQEALI